MRASRLASRRACVEPFRRSDMSEPPGKPPGPSRTEPSAEATRASRRASRQARLEPERYTQAAEACVKPTVTTARRASHWGTLPSARAGGQFQYRTEPLRLFRCENLNGGRTWKVGHWGSYSCIIIERRRRPRAPYLLRDYRET